MRTRNRLVNIRMTEKEYQQIKKITSPNLQSTTDAFCNIYDAITALIEKCY